MAAEYSPAPQAYYSTKSTFTPLSSGQQTPANVSPTSPRSTVNIPSLHIQPPQVQPRKKPIYVPAALRKTEKPNRQSPPKIDSALNSAHSSWEAGFRKPTDDNALLDANVPRTLTEAELNVEAPLSPVTGPVTRVHWQVCIAFSLKLLAFPLFHHFCTYPIGEVSHSLSAVTYWLGSDLFSAKPVVLPASRHSSSRR